MTISSARASLVIAFAALGPGLLAAQTDYRNLDDHRPVGTEDAYPIERFAFGGPLATTG